MLNNDTFVTNVYKIPTKNWEIQWRNLFDQKKNLLNAQYFMIFKTHTVIKEKYKPNAGY